jgi:F-type H+-transporting ATPase subunit a
MTFLPASFSHLHRARMSRVIQLFTLLVVSVFGLTPLAAEGVAPKAVEVIPGVTNSMLTGWTVSALLVLFVLWLIGKPSIVPSKGQAVIESLIEGLRGIFEPIVGKAAFPTAFPLLITFFIFILFHNWMGLLPGVGTVGWGTTDASGHFHLTRALIRPHNADFNGTIALALISFGAWAIIVFKFAGPALIVKDLFGNKAWSSSSSASSRCSRSSSGPSRFRSASSATSSAAKTCCTARASSSSSTSWSCSSA